MPFGGDPRDPNEIFSVFTQQALHHALPALGVALSNEDQERLLEAYRCLDSFPDVVPEVHAGKDRGRTRVAFTDGVEVSARALPQPAAM